MEQVQRARSVRMGVLLFSLVFGIISISLLAIGVDNCSHADLRFATLLTFIAYMSIFTMMLLHFIHLAKFLKAIPGVLMVFYVGLVFLMFMIQYFLYDSN